MKYVLVLLVFVMAASCGEHIDSNDELVAGYQFKRDTVFWMKTNSWFESRDSIPYHVNDFGVVDTLAEFERYIIVDTASKDLPPVHVPYITSPNGGPVSVDVDLRFRYGAKNYDNEVVIFPRFNELLDLGSGYFGVRKFRNQEVWGVLHIRGEMITDIKYTMLKVDSLTGNIVGSYQVIGGMAYDTLIVRP